jgi:hypothetical protein
MKNIILFSLIVLSCSFFGQNKNISEKKDSLEIDVTQKIILENLNDKNSANWKDVLTNYLQIALKDLGGKDKKVEFKTTLFNLKAQVDKNLWIDYNYEKENFARNFQIEAGLSLKDDYNLKGFTYGLGWAYNQRDKSINTFVKKKSGEFYKEYRHSLTFALNSYRQDLLKIYDETKTNEILKVIDDIEKKFKSPDKIMIIPLKEFPMEFQEYLPPNYNDYYEKFDKQYNEDLAEIERKPYFFIGFNSSFSETSKFLEEYKIETIFLKGIKTNKLKMEIDFRNSLNSSKDSLNINKRFFASQLGLNVSFLSKERSVLEIKPAFEFKKDFTNEVKGQSEVFYATSDIRIRVYKDVWIPLILKYDIKNGNLFGFLNLSINFDAVKNE